MSRPKVSVIIPARNAGTFMDAALSSIWRQYYDCLEVIVVDAGSTDDTAEVAENHSRAGYPVRILHEGAIHPSRARNIGIAQAKFSFIAFLDADDLWPKGKLARQMGRLSALPEVQMVTGYVTYFEAACPIELEPMPGTRTASLFHVQAGACIYRRDAFEKMGGAFDESLVYSEDVDLLLRVRETGLPFSILRSTELFYRIHPASMMAQATPLKDTHLRLAMSRSLQRRRKAGTLDTPLPDFSNYLEPLS